MCTLVYFHLLLCMEEAEEANFATNVYNNTHVYIYMCMLAYLCMHCYVLKKRRE